MNYGAHAILYSADADATRATLAQGASRAERTAFRGQAVALGPHRA
jgi:hypothetical protein